MNKQVQLARLLPFGMCLCTTVEQQQWILYYSSLRFKALAVAQRESSEAGHIRLVRHVWGTLARHPIIPMPSWGQGQHHVSPSATLTNAASHAPEGHAPPPVGSCDRGWCHTLFIATMLIHQWHVVHYWLTSSMNVCTKCSWAIKGLRDWSMEGSDLPVQTTSLAPVNQVTQYNTRLQ